jgi:hypothetical protein
VLRFIVDIVLLLVAKKTANTRWTVIAFGQNETVKLVRPGVPECSNCQEPAAGGVFSDDGDVYLCPTCLAFHDEYRRIMARIENEQKIISDHDDHADGSPV